MKSSWLRSIRFHILVAVNGTFAALLAALLFDEYRWEMTVRFAEKQTALQQQATLIAESLTRMRQLGPNVIQAYLDSVCSRVPSSSTPGYFIAVQFEGENWHAGRRPSDEIVTAVMAAAAENRTARLSDDELVVGSEFRPDMSVLVAQSARNVREAALTETLWHLAFVAVLSIVATGVVNYLLIHTIDRPLRRLVATVTEIGRGRFGVQTGEFDTVELTALAKAVDGMSVSLADAEARRREQIKKGREIQSHLLPNCPQLPGARFERLYRPADEVSGDYCDVFSLQDGSTLVCVADVVGHGVPAAMTASMLKVLLSQVTRERMDPAEILSCLNQQLLQVTLPGDFASVFLVRWRAGDGMLQYASAGHGTTWFAPQKSPCRLLESTGLLLGIESSATWETRMLAIASGDRLLLATDGLTETSNDRELFGPRRVTSLLAEHASLAPGELTDVIERTLIAFRNGAPQTDDLTLVLLEFTEETLTAVQSAAGGFEEMIRSASAEHLALLPVPGQEGWQSLAGLIRYPSGV